MAEEAATAASFRGLKVVAFESRRAQEIAALITRHGGLPLVAPALREAPLEENAAAFAFGEQLLAGKLDALICMTGVGTQRLLEVLEKRYPRERILQGLSRITLVVRGPKPLKVLRELQVPVTISVPEPNTWREILQELDESPRGFTLAGSRIAVQEYGVPNAMLIKGLQERGAEVLRVPVYQWALPEDLNPLRAAFEALVEAKARVVLFTNSAQVEHVFQVASESGLRERLLGALRNCVVASVGPTCSEALLAHGVQVDIEPVHGKMGALVHEAATRSSELLEKKSEDRNQKAEGRKQKGEDLTATGLRQPPPTTFSDPSSTPLSIVQDQRPALTEVIAAPSRAATAWIDSRFMRACRREPVDATPIWLMRQAGRYMKEYREMRARVPFLELCKNPDLVSEVTVTATEKLGVDAAIIFSDLLLIVEPLGYHLEYDKGDGPVITPELRAPSDLERLREVEPRESLGYVYEAIRRTRARLAPRTPLIGFAACPFTLASYLIEGGGSKNYVNTKTLMYRDPGAWLALMEHLARSLALYINGQIAAGVQAVQVFDTWVGCLGPGDYREFVLPYTRTMMQGITPGTPIIHFGTGTAMLLEDMRDAGGDVIGVDARVELDEAWARLGDRVGVQGNLDPVVLFGDQAFIRKRVEKILDQAAGRPGHIFNLGHGLLPGTPYENVVALVEMVHELSSRGYNHPPSTFG
jgi:uroporphyrinogen decarboxylase